MDIKFVVRSGKGGGAYTFRDGVEEHYFTDEVGGATRSVKQHAGWQSVTYKGQRYALKGGIHTDYFINLALPIKKRV